MPNLDVAELARSLEKTTGYLDKFIAAEAQKRANKLAVEYAKAADERIRDNAADMQRLGNLVAELRRQMKPLTRDAYSYFALEMRVLELANLAEGGGDVGPARMLRTAISEAQASGRARWEQEQAAAAQQRETAGG